MTALRLLFGHLDHFHRQFVMTFVAGLVDGVLAYIIPIFLAEFTRRGLTVDNLLRLPSYLIAIYFFSLSLQFLLRRYGEALGPKFGIHLRLKYFQALEALPASRLTTQHSGYVLSLINRVTDGLAGLVVEIIWGVARTITGLLLFFFFTARESMYVASLNVVVIAIFIALSTRLSKKMVPLVTDVNTKRARLLERYTDFLSNVLTVKKLGLYEFAQSGLVIRSKENSESINRVQQFHAGRWLFLHLLFGIAFLSTLIFLLVQITAGVSPPSILILFVAAYSMVRTSAERLSENFRSLLEMNAYVQDLEKIVSLDEAGTLAPMSNRQVWQRIQFCEVEFEYPGNEKRIRIPEFELCKGDIIGVRGVSGEGKTTFLHLLANLYSPQSGSRLLDSRVYEDFERRTFEQIFVVISQEVEMFHMSLRENICLGHEVAESRLVEALQALDLYEWVQSLDSGLDTHVGEKGVRLSAGQKQRVNLLRGLLLDRDVYLLDEPTSHLDSATEKRVVEFLRRELAGKTAVLVTHRDALRDLCVKQFRMLNGVLVSEATVI